MCDKGERIVPEDKFNYNIGIDDINRLREQGFGMHESRRMLRVERLLDAVADLDVDKRCKHILKAILELL